MRKLPCKDCICLPICKARYYTHLKISEVNTNITSTMPTSVRDALEIKCKILRNYTTSPNQYLRLGNVQEFHRFMQNLDPPKNRNQYK